MKIAFSTQNVPSQSFLETCNIANEYGFSGFEIYDAQTERACHSDSILKNNSSAGAKRKLRNRGIAIPALTYPCPIEQDSSGLEEYVEMAAGAAIPYVILRTESEPDMAALDRMLESAIHKAEKYDVTILLETCGPLANTQKVIGIFNHFASVALGAAWNIRETYFAAGESAEMTIQTLGAYIKYVRMGDRKDDLNVLIGEGHLPVSEFFGALRSLNYEGYVCADWNDEVNNPDIVGASIRAYINALNKIVYEEEA